MDQNETQWDRLLKIKTTGRDDSHSDQYRYPYEPTQYCVLERLAHSGLIGKVRRNKLSKGSGNSRKNTVLLTPSEGRHGSVQILCSAGYKYSDVQNSSGLDFIAGGEE